MDISNLLTIIKSRRWDIQRFNGYPFFLSSAAVLSGSHLPWGLSYTHFLYISHSKNVEMYYDTADYQRIGEIFWENVKSISDLEILAKESESTYAEIVSAAAYDAEELGALSERELKELLWQQVRLISAGVGTGHCIECATYVAEQRLHVLYPQGWPEIEASEPSFLKKAEMFARQLINEGYSKAEIIQRFNDEYGWIKNSYVGRQDITISDIEHLAQDETVHPLRNISNVEGDSMIAIISHIFAWQDRRKSNILKGIHSAEPVLRACAERFSIPFDHIRFLVPEEVERLGDIFFHQELAKRSTLFVDYSSYEGPQVLYTGSDAEMFVSGLENDVNNVQDNIKGSTGYKGCVQGIARVCLSLESIEDFKEGEILVASMTRPEYVTAMKKAIAFVTDEGGITCHAAIIAREMKKPCIIGTKNATKVIKDGDMIEVDADTGIITVLR